MGQGGRGHGGGADDGGRNGQVGDQLPVAQAGDRREDRRADQGADAAELDQDAVGQGQVLLGPGYLRQAGVGRRRRDAHREDQRGGASHGRGQRDRMGEGDRRQGRTGQYRAGQQARADAAAQQRRGAGVPRDAGGRRGGGGATGGGRRQAPLDQVGGQQRQDRDRHQRQRAKAACQQQRRREPEPAPVSGRRRGRRARALVAGQHQHHTGQHGTRGGQRGEPVLPPRPARGEPPGRGADGKAGRRADPPQGQRGPGARGAHLPDQDAGPPD